MSKLQKIILIIAGVLAVAVFIIAPVQLKIANYYIEKANDNLDNHFYKSAFLNYEKASALLPDDEKLKIQLGKIDLLKNNLEEAEKEFKKAVKINHNSPKASSFLVNTLLLEKNLKEAEKFAKEAPKKVLEDKDFQIQESRVCASLGKIDEALSVLENNESQETLFYKAVFYIAKKDFTKAQDLIKNIISENPELKDKLSQIDNAFLKIKTSENETYKTVTFAEVLNEVDEPYLAERMLKEVLDKNPGYRDAYIFLGYSNYLKKDFAQGRDFINQAIGKDPSYGLSYYFLGLVDLEENKEVEAENNFRKAINFGYKGKQIFKVLAELEKQKKDFSKAEENFKAALIFNQEDQEILKEITEVLIAQKKLDEAEKIALNLSDNELLGWIYLEKGDEEKALDFLKKAEEKNHFSAFVALKTGELYKKQNKIDEAKNYFLKTQEYDLFGNWAKLAEEELKSN